METTIDALFPARIRFAETEYQFSEQGGSRATVFTVTQKNLVRVTAAAAPN